MRVGLRPPFELFEAGADTLARAVRRAEGLGLDHLTTGDHVAAAGRITRKKEATTG